MKRFAKPGSPMRAVSVLQGMRVEVTSISTLSVSNRSPTETAAAVDALDDEVLAEGSRLQRPAELLRPPGEVDPAETVDRLFRPAMVFLVADRVAQQALAVDDDGRIGRRLENARLVAFARDRAGDDPCTRRGF
jgi:hypothetical protein